jgi:hypothetical protein
MYAMCKESNIKCKLSNRQKVAEKLALHFSDNPSRLYNNNTVSAILHIHHVICIELWQNKTPSLVVSLAIIQELQKLNNNVKQGDECTKIYLFERAILPYL